MCKKGQPFERKFNQLRVRTVLVFASLPLVSLERFALFSRALRAMFATLLLIINANVTQIEALTALAQAKAVFHAHTLSTN